VIDQFFKLERACEEIQHLNIEIPHVVTYIQDEDMFLQSKEAEIRQVSPGLAQQVGKHRMERAHFNDQHMCRFWKLALLPGFTGTIKPSVSIELGRRADNLMDIDCNDGNREDGDDNGHGEAEEDKDEEEDEQREEEIHAVVSALIALTIDG